MNIADELRKLQELHQSGALTDQEFAAAKAAVLAGNTAGGEAEAGEAVREQVEEIRRQNEVAQLDREWQLERERYLVTNRYGQRYIPTPGLSLLGGIVVAVFGALWTLFAGGIAATVGGPALVFPCFGVVFIVFGVGVSIYSYTKARQYQRAYDAYQHRRREAARRASGEG